MRSPFLSQRTAPGDAQSPRPDRDRPDPPVLPRAPAGSFHTGQPPRTGFGLGFFFVPSFLPLPQPLVSAFPRVEAALPLGQSPLRGRGARFPGAEQSCRQELHLERITLRKLLLSNTHSSVNEATGTKWVKKGKSGYQNCISHFPFSAVRQVVIYCGFKLR